MFLFKAGNAIRYPALTSSINSVELTSNGTQVWHKNAAFHRGNNLPAFIYANGTKEWWTNGGLIRSEKAGNNASV